MKRILFTISIITVISSITNAKYSGGSGSINDPYLISTAEDMNQIGHNQADWDKHFKMTADINLSAYSGTQFNRIGTNEIDSFSGVFDGNGYTIRGFTYTTDNIDYAGIFGAVGPAGKIENLSLADVHITGRDYIGSIAGSNDGNISNCNSTGNITSPNGIQCLGGLVGSNNSGNISNCYCETNVVGEGEWSDYIGGLAGFNGGNINNCYAAGEITGGDFSFFIGGLVGYNEEGSIISSYFPDTEPDNGIGTPLTDEQMKQRNSFAGWDFVWETANGTDDIWAICEGISPPKLARQFIRGDCDNDKDVDFADFARMAMKWQQTEPNLYCGGTDLNGDGIVNTVDLSIMCSHWLQGT